MNPYIKNPIPGTIKHTILNVPHKKPGQGGSNFRLTLPTSWIRYLNLSEGSRLVTITLFEDRIEVRKDTDN